MYRILIKESISSNKNTFYVENEEIYETSSLTEITDKYKELLYQYPKSRIDVVDNTIEVVDADFDEAGASEQDLQHIYDELGDILG